MSKSRRHELGVGVLVLGAMALLAYMALQVGALRGLGSYLDVHASLPDAAGLAQGAVVKVAGVDVGRIKVMRVDQGRAVLEMEVREDAGLRQDALVTVRARSVLGEKFVELVPQSTDAPLLQEGDQLAVAATPVEIDQLVNQLGPLVEAIDPIAVQDTLGVVQEALNKDPQRVERMLVDLETLLDNAATASAELPGLVAETKSTLQVVRTTAQEARPVIARADRIATELEGATADLDRTRAEVDGLIADTRSAVKDGGALVDRLEGNGDRLETILRNLEEIDKWELRRLLREEGILVRLRGREVEEPDDDLVEEHP